MSISASSTEITALLTAWRGGDRGALSRLVERIYPELRVMAHRFLKNERPGGDVQATALVHEVYLRLVEMTNAEARQRPQFLALAAKIMRHILVDAARARGARKRGGDAVPVDFNQTADRAAAPDQSVLAVDELLTKLSQLAPRQAQVVELHYFGGLSEQEIVTALNISPRTVRRDWDFSKAWLLRELRGGRPRRKTHEQRRALSPG